MKRDDDLLFYKECWCELHGILSKIVDKNPSKYFHFVEDILTLMRYLEWKYQ